MSSKANTRCQQLPNDKAIFIVLASKQWVGVYSHHFISSGTVNRKQIFVFPPQLSTTVSCNGVSRFRRAVLREGLQTFRWVVCDKHHLLAYPLIHAWLAPKPKSLPDIADFLPMKCDACQEIFCKDHVTYANHKCTSSYKKVINKSLHFVDRYWLNYG